MLNPSGSIDPDLLRSRVETIGDAAERQVVGLVVERARGGRGSHGIDLVTLERDAGSRGSRDLWGSVEPSVAALWARIEELREALEPLAADHEPEGPGEADLESLIAPPPVVADAEAAVAPPPVRRRSRPRAVSKSGVPTPEGRIRETAWAMSFVLSSELDGFHRRLPALLRMPDGWELVGAVQEHLGHLQAGVGAVLTGVYASLPGGEACGGDVAETLTLVSAKELRARVFQLRDDVLVVERQLTSTSGASWQPALASLLRLLDALVFSPAFAWMRAGDKRSFLVQRRALGELLVLWSPLRATPALRVVQGLARYLEALEVINQRECLVEHDRAALGRVVESLDSAPAGAEGRAAIGRALGSLAEVQWRDRRLDDLLAQTLDPARPPPLLEILNRSREVLMGLDGGRERATRTAAAGGQRSSSS
jgi:hypothetical protein